MASGAAAPPRTRAARQADFDRQIEEKQKELDDGKSSRKDTRREEVEWAAMRKVLEGQIADLKTQRAAPPPPGESGARFRPATAPRRPPRPAREAVRGVGLEQPRDERLRDVLERTWEVDKGTFGVKQLAREAKRVWAEDGQAGRPPTQAEVAEYIGLDERAQLRAPLPPWGGKTNPGTYPLERMDIDLVDFSKTTLPSISTAPASWRCCKTEILATPGAAT